MSTVYRLLGTRSYWGLIGAEAETQLDLELLARRQLCALQDNRLDVYLGEQVPSTVTIDLAPPPAEAPFKAEATFSAGLLSLDDSEAGYTRTDVDLPHRGVYLVTLTELERAEGHRRFHVTLDPR